MQMLHDLTGNSDYVTLKQTAAERTMWRYSRGISRTCSTAEYWRKEGRSTRSGRVHFPMCGVVMLSFQITLGMTCCCCCCRNTLLLVVGPVWHLLRFL